jgi:hypothetical protein
MDKTLEAVVNRHLAAENAHQMEETLAALHPDCLFEDLPLGKTYRGRPGAERYYRFWWGAFDLEVKGEHRHWSEDGAFMIAQTWYEDVHRGQFLDYAPTDRPIRFPLAVRDTVPRRSDGRRTLLLRSRHSAQTDRRHATP